MVRCVLPSDAEAIACVHVAAWHAAYRGLMPDAVLDAVTLESRIARWKQNLTAPNPALHTAVLEREGRVIAFASSGPNRDQPGQLEPGRDQFQHNKPESTERQCGEVWALYAHPDSWGTGAGRVLLADALVHFERGGFQVVMLWVLEGNARAIRFYERAGFRFDGGKRDEGGLPRRRMRCAVAR
ncbi:MAG: GNAT family N-acetyltransferase [Polyangiales bacterium]